MAGYCNIPVREEYLYKEKLPLHMGAFRYRRMLFSLPNASSTFQLALYIIPNSVGWPSCLVYLDVYIVFNANQENNIEDIDSVFKFLGLVGVTLTIN